MENGTTPQTISQLCRKKRDPGRFVWSSKHRSWLTHTWKKRRYPTPLWAMAYKRSRLPC